MYPLVPVLCVLHHTVVGKDHYFLRRRYPFPLFLFITNLLSLDGQWPLTLFKIYDKVTFWVTSTNKVSRKSVRDS